VYERQQARDLDEAFELEGQDEPEQYEAHELDTFLHHSESPHSDDDERSDDEQNMLPGAHHRDPSSVSLFSLDSIPMIPLSLSQARAPDLQKKVSLINGLGLVIGSMIGSGLFSSPGMNIRVHNSIEFWNIKTAVLYRSCTRSGGSSRHIFGCMACVWLDCHGWSSLLCRIRIYASDERRRDSLFEQSLWELGIIRF
jgi:hypothetical protein